MTFIEFVKNFFTAPFKKESFRGRISRSEFLTALALYNLILFGLVLLVVAPLLAGGGANIAQVIESLAGPKLIILLPLLILMIGHNLSITGRRLHDIGLPAILFLILVIPIPIVQLAFIILTLTIPGSSSKNQYGTVPKNTRRMSDMFFNVARSGEYPKAAKNGRIFGYVFLGIFMLLNIIPMIAALP